MKVRISYRHLDPSPSVENKIHDKLRHLEKYFKGKMNVNWVCSIDGEGHRSEVSVNVGKLNFHAHSIAPVLYSTLDDAIAKVERQIRRKNNQLKDKIHRENPRSMIA